MGQGDGTVTEAVRSQLFSETKDGQTGVRVFDVAGSLSPYDAYSTEGVPVIGDRYISIDYPAVIFEARCIKKSVTNIDKNDDIHQITCNYKFDKEEDLFPEAGDERVKFEPTSSSVKINVALLQDRFGTLAHPAPVHEHAIGVTEDEIQGVFVFDNSERLIVTQWVTIGSFTDAFQDLVRLVRNTKNSEVWYGAAVGECLFVGMREIAIREVDDLVKLEFEFLISRNIAENKIPIFKDIDDTTIVVTDGKLGWDYLWVLTGIDEKSKPPKTYTKGVYVSKVYEDNNFTTLGLSGVR